MKHTPGPWTVMDRNIYAADVYAPNSVDASGLIASVRLNTNHGYANAHLIAAAPELLDALKALRFNDCFCEVRIGNPMFRGQHTAACIAANAAIAKAEGQS